MVEKIDSCTISLAMHNIYTDARTSEKMDGTLTRIASFENT